MRLNQKAVLELDTPKPKTWAKSRKPEIGGKKEPRKRLLWGLVSKEWQNGAFRRACDCDKVPIPSNTVPQSNPTVQIAHIF